MPAADGAAACAFCVVADTAAFMADGRFLALHNIAPVLPGHSLVIPRRHVASLLELEDDDLAAMMLFARRTTRLLARVFASDGFDWTVQDGAAAGQTVPHPAPARHPRHADDYCPTPATGIEADGKRGRRPRRHASPPPEPGRARRHYRKAARARWMREQAPPIARDARDRLFPAIFSTSHLIRSIFRLWPAGVAGALRAYLTAGRRRRRAAAEGRTGAMARFTFNRTKTVRPIGSPMSLPRFAARGRFA
ncbi:MAG: HIT family protein [Rhodospirillales bacterium]